MSDIARLRAIIANESRRGGPDSPLVLSRVAAYGLPDFLTVRDQADFIHAVGQEWLVEYYATFSPVVVGALLDIAQAAAHEQQCLADHNAQEGGAGGSGSRLYDAQYAVRFALAALDRFAAKA